MRIWLSGPRVAGIRLGLSLGPEDFGGARRARGASRQSSAEPGSFVYVISDGHRVKVGSSIDPDRRLRELQTGNPRKLQFLFVGVTPGSGYDIELKAQDMLAAHGASIGGSEWFDVSRELAAAAVMGSAGTIGQKLLAISPSQVGQIVRIAQAGGHEEIRAQNTGKWLAMCFFVTVFVVLYAYCGTCSSRLLNKSFAFTGEA
jgi:T5orf172 domain-containing protein